MDKKRWTESQMDAICARDGTILVSAAAGSGKTAVLVQRVIERLIDEKNPCDANKLLVVTFTNAAALEMRERISSKIDELIYEDPYNMRLKKQKILLNSARISTVHSFCNDVVRENFYKLGISQNFRISDQNEMLLIRNETAREIINDLYLKNDMQFNNLIDAFCSNKNDKKIIDIINKLYDFIRSHPFPLLWLDEKLSMYNPTCLIEDTKWGITVIDFAKDAIDYCINITKESILMLNEDIKLNEAYFDAFSLDLSGLKVIKDAISKRDFDSICKALKLFSFEKLKSIRGYKDNEVKIKACENRDEVKSVVSKLCKLFYTSKDECLSDIKYLYPIVEELFLVVKMFSDKLEKIKLDKNIADFSDLEHYMIKLLVRPSKDGFVRTEDAIKLSQEFDEIMVDEYQDTNEAQDIIFRAISKDESNMFMVGDVKQSIYRFRQAMPEIFLRRKEKYSKYDKNENNYPSKIILDKNFRSREGVINCVNFVFRQIMSKTVGDMDYNTEEELVCKADYEKNQEPDASLHIIDLSKFESLDMDIAEASHISKLILDMIKNEYQIRDGDKYRTVTYKDFCILIRNANKHANIYARELKKNKIPVFSDISGSFFKSTEIAVMISMLRIIDNPIQDIPLISILMSPIYGFTPDKLAQIRQINKKVPLYFVLKEFSDKGDNDSIKFIEDIEYYRGLSAYLTSYDLINRIYERTGYLAIVSTMKDPDIRIANLRLLLKMAKDNESRGYKGLSSFIWFIDKLEQQSSDMFESCNASYSSNAVKIMSIHRSKGLEFPICILAGTSRKFNNRVDDILLHPSMGLGIKIRDTKRMIEYSTMPREAVLIESQREDMSEELRILYVAMTRAKEKLIILSSLKDVEKTIQKLASGITDNMQISPYKIRKASSLSDLIILSLIRHPASDKLRSFLKNNNVKILSTPGKLEVKIVYPEVNIKEDEGSDKLVEDHFDEDLFNLIKNRLNYVYKKKELLNIASKVSVSDLMDEHDNSLETLKKPSFLDDLQISPAQKGSIIHKFIEYSDYKLARKDIKAEAENLISKGILSYAEINSIDISKLSDFYNSGLMNRILNSDKILREYRFTVDISAAMINSDINSSLKDEVVVLQGAVDCVIIENNQAVIIDYKTDRIRNPKVLESRYSKQLRLYKYALERSLNIKVKECILYSIYSNKEITIS